MLQSIAYFTQLWVSNCILSCSTVCCSKKVSHQCTTNMKPCTQCPLYAPSVWLMLVTLKKASMLPGPAIPWRPGRSDQISGESCGPDGRLPDASLGSKHLREIFYRMGFNDQEIVALSGAHTLGRCHPDRSGFKGPWTNSPTTFSNLYFQELVNNKWYGSEPSHACKLFLDCNPWWIDMAVTDFFSVANVVEKVALG